MQQKVATFLNLSFCGVLQMYLPPPHSFPKNCFYAETIILHVLAFFGKHLEEYGKYCHLSQPCL